MSWKSGVIGQGPPCGLYLCHLNCRSHCLLAHCVASSGYPVGLRAGEGGDMGGWEASLKRWCPVHLEEDCCGQVPSPALGSGLSRGAGQCPLSPSTAALLGVAMP